MPTAAVPSAPSSLRTPAGGLAALARSRDVAVALAAVTVACFASWMAGYRVLLPSFPVADIVALSAFDVASWLAACAGGAAVGWLIPVAGRPSLRHAAAVAAFALAFSLVRIAGKFYLARVIGPPPSSFGAYFVILLPTSFLTASTFAGLGMGLHARVRERERAAAAARMEAELAGARRRALHGRLRPEFLLDALDAISRGIPGNAAAADRLLVRLGELLRLSLQRVRADQVPLSAELMYVAALLEVRAGGEKRAARFRLRVPDGLLDARVPPGCLATFVEAALGAVDGPGRPPRIVVRARARDGRLRLRVADDAPLTVARREREGVRALARSLEERFGAAGRVRYAGRPGGGGRGMLELPLDLAGRDGEAR